MGMGKQHQMEGRNSPDSDTFCSSTASETGVLAMH